MKRYNTPHRSRVVKTRMTEEEYAMAYEAVVALQKELVALRSAHRPLGAE